MTSKQVDIMDFKVLERTDTTLEIEIVEADDTVMYPLIEEMLKNEKIIDADYSVEHPKLDDPILFIEVEEGEDPKETLVEISRSFREELEEVYSDIFEEEEE